MNIRESKEYVNAFARYIKTGDETEVRSLLTENATEGGQIPVPVYVEGRIRQAWENDEIMSRVKRTYLKGNIKVGFEVSGTDAVIHAEGTEAPDEETLTLGIASLTPQSIKKWITVSDEALDLNGEEFLAYIYDELTYKIIHKAADTLIDLVVAAPEQSTETTPGQSVITSAPALGTASSAIAGLSDQANAPVAIMNKSTWAAFKAVQYAGNYAVDPFEGMTVLFTSKLKAYDAAEENECYMIVGDLGIGAQANLPSGDDVKLTFDNLTLAERDLVKIVGRLFVALGIVTPKAFTRVLKPEAEAKN